MKVALSSASRRVLSMIPWRMRSLNNFLMASANWLFEDVIRTPPVRIATGVSVEAHSLICHRDVNMALTSVKSFMRYMPAVALVLHDDGSITQLDRALLSEHLPGARFIGRAEADREMQRILPSDVYAKRAQHVFLLKLFDFNHFHDGQTTILLDSDIVFLAPPTEVINWLASEAAAPFYNLDWCPSYRASSVPDGLTIPPKLNAGFMGYRGRFSMKQIYDYCARMDYWIEDQTIYALLLADLDAKALDPNRYRVYTGGSIAPDTPMVHFISPSRFKALLYPRLARRVYRELRRIR